MRPVLVLLLSACVGCAGVWGFADLTGGDAGASTEGGAGADGGMSADGGETDAIAATDGAVTVDVVTLDAVTVDVAAVDTGSSQESGVCTPIGSASPLCGTPDGVPITTPSTFCLVDDTANKYLAPTTPSACQCAGAYTCACLQASAYVPPLPWCVVPNTSSGCFCDDSSSGPVVTCYDAFPPGRCG